MITTKNHISSITSDKIITKNLALFDLDHTLLDIDSDYAWGEFLVNNSYVDETEYRQANDKFYQDYIAGTLDAVEYNEFVAKFLTTKPLDELLSIRTAYIDTIISQQIRRQAQEAIKQHLDNGDEVAIISATNDFVVNGVAEKFKIPLTNVLATPLEIKHNKYTGKLMDKPNFQAGKIYHLKKWLDKKSSQDIDFRKTYAYSDSKNDLPLLEWADIAICVTPDDTLSSIAVERGWEVLDWSIGQ